MLSKKLKWGRSCANICLQARSYGLQKICRTKAYCWKATTWIFIQLTFVTCAWKERESSLLLLQNYANEEAQNKGRPPKLFKGHLELVDSLLSFLHPNSKFSPHTSLFWSHWAVFLNSKWRNLRAFFFWEERFIIHLVFIYFTSFRKII